MWKTILAGLLQWLASLLTKKPMADPTDITLAVDAAPLATAMVNGATEGLKVYSQLEALANSPDMQKAAAAKAKLAEIDALVTAQKQNNLEVERKAFEHAKP